MPWRKKPCRSVKWLAHKFTYKCLSLYMLKPGTNKDNWPAPGEVASILFDVSIGGHHPEWLANFLVSGHLGQWDLIVTCEDTVARLIPEHRVLLENYPRVLVFPGWPSAQFFWEEFRLVLEFLKKYPQAILVHLEISNLLKGIILMQWMPGSAGLIRRLTGVFFKSRPWFERRQSLKKWVKYKMVDFSVSRWIWRMTGCRAGFLTKTIAEEYKQKFPERVVYVPDPLPAYLDLFPDTVDGKSAGVDGPPALTVEQDQNNEANCPDRDTTMDVKVRWRACLLGPQGPRKGTDFAIRALEAYWKGPEVLELVLAGSCRRCPWVVSYVPQNPYLKLTLINRVLSDEDFYRTAQQSDVSLTPYDRHYSPSGVLLVSIYAWTPVLSTDQGHMGEEIKRTGVGRVFPPKNEEQFVFCLNELLRTSFQVPEIGRRTLLDEHNRVDCVKAVCLLDTRQQA